MKKATARKAGFSLPETMVALGVGSIMLGGLMVTSTNLQRWFSAADYLLGCQQDQATALDFLARDIRRASSATQENGDRKLTLTIPDQTVRATDGSLKAPTLTTAGLRYGTVPVTVSYFVQGTSLVRQEGAAQLVVSNNLDEFHATVGSTPVVTLQLLFKPAPKKPTGLRVTTTVRQRNSNHRLQ